MILPGDFVGVVTQDCQFHTQFQTLMPKSSSPTGDIFASDRVHNDSVGRTGKSRKLRSVQVKPSEHNERCHCPPGGFMHFT